MPDDLTPAQKQYWDIKKNHADALLFFRMGDFYEMFGDDAKLASKLLGLTLTSRDKKSKDPVPMAGVPYHSVNKYISQLSRQGYKVAICEQMTDPSLPGIVERAVVRIITPGTIVEDDMLDQKKNNFLVCITEKNNAFGLSYTDTSTGDFFVTEVDTMARLKDELFKLTPAEIIFPKDRFAALDFVDYVKQYFHSSVSFFQLFEDPEELLLRHFRLKSLAGFGVENMALGIQAAGYLLSYLQENQKTDRSNITSLKAVHLEKTMPLDEHTIRNLELVTNSYDGKKDGSLLSVLDQTVTSMGGRLLYQWLLQPLLDKDEINSRLEAVEVFFADKILRHEVRELLKSVLDIERLLAKMVFKKSIPRDLVGLKQTLAALPTLEKILKKQGSIVALKGIIKNLSQPSLTAIHDLINQALDENASVFEDSKVIKEGYHAEIDELRKLVFQGKDWIVHYQQELQDKTGIGNLKVHFNSVFGYYIEISRSHLGKVPADFVRKQTLVNAERFITPELKEYEDKVFHAEEKLLQLERQEFEALQVKILDQTVQLQQAALALATLDVLVSFAELASDQHYVRPSMTVNTGVLDIQQGRHPVVEKFVTEHFVTNDLHLEKTKRMMLLTGPNMAGKSTYLRQNALIILLAHIGCFVPATSCTLDVVDRIFTRIGASDVLIKGQSTFLVEMQETANILNNATDKSFIILDEVGRGTSTYDGLSLAWSILEYLHYHTKAKVLFATHYHELITIVSKMPASANFSMAVMENTDGVVFLRKVVPGGVDKSYGIEVAKISGLPQDVIERAKQVLTALESEKDDQQLRSAQLSFLEPQVIETVKIVRKDSELEKKLAALDLNGLTPLEALNVLATLKQQMKK